MSNNILPEIVETDCTALLTKIQCTQPLTKEFFELSLRNVKLFDNKMKDYGVRNIQAFGFFGCIVRMSDKFERIKNLTGAKRRRAVNESLIDSLDDISNYAIIAKMCHRGVWPK